jgi:hypothetical protein
MARQRCRGFVRNPPNYKSHCCRAHYINNRRMAALGRLVPMAALFHVSAVRTSVWVRTNEPEEKPELNRKRTRASILLVARRCLLFECSRPWKCRAISLCWFIQYPPGSTRWQMILTAITPLIPMAPMIPIHYDIKTFGSRRRSPLGPILKTSPQQQKRPAGKVPSGTWFR